MRADHSRTIQGEDDMQIIGKILLGIPFVFQLGTAREAVAREIRIMVDDDGMFLLVMGNKLGADKLEIGIQVFAIILITNLFSTLAGMVAIRGTVNADKTKFTIGDSIKQILFPLSRYDGSVISFGINGTQIAGGVENNGSIIFEIFGGNKTSILRMDNLNAQFLCNRSQKTLG